MAKNYMADVAKMLGVELGEKFKLKTDGHILELRNINGGYDEVAFWFTDDGIAYDSYHSVLNADKEDNVHLLFDIIVGKYEVVKQPRKPKYRDVYYYPAIGCGWVATRKWRDETKDYCLYTLGMCYKTLDEAEEHFAEDYKRLTGKELKQ